MTNTDLLKKKIEDSGYKMKYIASKIGLSYQGFLNKIQNQNRLHCTGNQRAARATVHPC